MQNLRRTNRWSVPTNVAEEIKITQKLLRSVDVPVNTVSSLEVPVTTGWDATELVTELFIAKVRITELESVESINVCQHKEILNEIK